MGGIATEIETQLKKQRQCWNSLVDWQVQVQKLTERDTAGKTETKRGTDREMQTKRERDIQKKRHIQLKKQRECWNSLIGLVGLRLKLTKRMTPRETQTARAIQRETDTARETETIL